MKVGQQLTALSVYEGRKTVGEMAHLVRAGNRRRSEQAVRYARVGCLREKGFFVCREPTAYSEDHLVVQFLGDWGDNEEEALDGCLEDPVWGE